jgi:hypothetical protein
MGNLSISRLFPNAELAATVWLDQPLAKKSPGREVKNHTSHEDI